MFLFTCIFFFDMSSAMPCVVSSCEERRKQITPTCPFFCDAKAVSRIIPSHAVQDCQQEPTLCRQFPLPSSPRSQSLLTSTHWMHSPSRGLRSDSTFHSPTLPFPYPASPHDPRAPDLHDATVFATLAAAIALFVRL